jgi:hypothetical protein
MRGHQTMISWGESSSTAASTAGLLQRQQSEAQLAKRSERQEGPFNKSVLLYIRMLICVNNMLGRFGEEVR